MPKNYLHVAIEQSKLAARFEEFDFSFYNKTRFAGLENNLPNCYCNALLQVFFFIPALRYTSLSQCSDVEFCLVDELGFLFHMLQTARGKARHQPQKIGEGVRVQLSLPTNCSAN